MSKVQNYEGMSISQLLNGVQDVARSKKSNSENSSQPVRRIVTEGKNKNTRGGHLTL